MTKLILEPYLQQMDRWPASGRHILAAETWNEFSEGTDIQETVEAGRQYIDLTRRYVDQFKGLIKISASASP